VKGHVSVKEGVLKRQSLVQQSYRSYLIGTDITGAAFENGHGIARIADQRLSEDGAARSHAPALWQSA